MSAPHRIRAEALSLDEITREVRHPGAGAIATFEGTVRDVNEGRAVTLLEYEAYGPMAEAEIAKILDEIRAEIPGVRVAAVHRIGALSVGDAAVLCAASAPHRGEAFRACRLAIDRIKARLPHLEAQARSRRPLLGRLGGRAAPRRSRSRPRPSRARPRAPRLVTAHLPVVGSRFSIQAITPSMQSLERRHLSCPTFSRSSA